MTRRRGLAGATLVLALMGGGRPARAGMPPSWDENPRVERREARWRKAPGAAIPEMVKAVCRQNESAGEASALLKELGQRAVAPLLAALRSDRDCGSDAATLVAEIVCHAQAEASTDKMTGAFRPVRAALGAPDWKRVQAALRVIVEIGDAPPETPVRGRLAQARRARDVQCAASGPLLDASAAPLGTLLERTTRERRERVATVVPSLGPHAAPIVPVLLRMLANDEARFDAVTALRAIGPAAAPAAPALAELLASSEDPESRLRAVRALATMGPHATVAIPALRVRLAEVAASPCARREDLPWYLFALLNIGPGPGEAKDAWIGAAAADIQRALRAVSRCNADDEEEQLVALAAATLCAGAVGPLAEVIMDEGRSLSRRTRAAEALAPLHCVLPALEAATQKLLLDRESERLRVVVPNQVESDPSPAAAAAAWVSRAITRCDREAGRSTSEKRFESEQPDQNFEMARCLEDRLCGPGPERGARAMSTCCQRAYGRSAPAWCRPQ